MEINVAQMIEVNNIGKELIQRGWSQGCLVKVSSAFRMYLSLEKSTLGEIDPINTDPSVVQWSIQQEALDGQDCFIIISHSCDIQKSPKHEPYIEAMQAFSTNDRGMIHEASRNSVRYFLLRRYRSDRGQEEALIADATIRPSLEKASLLYLAPLTGIQTDKVILHLFRRWLARRYDRPALDDDLVNAVQKPIIKAIGKLRPTHPLQDTLDGISEVLFLLQNDTLPYQIVLLFMRTEHPDIPQVSIEQAADLAGWIDDILKRERGATLSNWGLFGTDEIRLKDYTNAFKLPLDQYSLHLDEN